MKDVTDVEGYLNDQTWSYDYHFSLNPHYIRFALALAGIAFQPPRVAYELAYGNGVSLLIHAAANQDIRWSGTDFNPDHARFARDLAGDCIPNLRLSDQGFGDYLEKGDADSVDLVSMTGTWSWISAADHQNIARFLSRKLRRGGVFCHDNMVLPGQLQNTALRQLLVAIATLDPPSRAANTTRIVPAIDRAIRLMDSNPGFLSNYPHARSMLEAMLKSQPHHLAHEYFNFNWQPRYFVETARLFDEASLEWACAWGLTEQCDELNYTSLQRDFLGEITGWNLREQIKDYMRLRGMRYDAWVREGIVRDPAVCERALTESHVILVKPASKFDYRFSGGLGEINLSRAIYKKALDILSERRAVSICHIMKCLPRSMTCEEMTTLVSILIDANLIQVTQHTTANIEFSREACTALNRAILMLTADTPVLKHLASPVTGGGIPVEPIHQFFLRARHEGARDSTGYADFAARQNAAEKVRSAEFKTLPTGIGDTPDIYLVQAQEFADEYLPIYQSLLVTD